MRPVLVRLPLLIVKIDRGELLNQQPKQEYIVGSLRGKQARTQLATGQNGPGVKGSRGTRNTGFSGGANGQEYQTYYQENLGLIYRYVYSKLGNRE